MSKRIYKILTQSQWSAASKEGLFRGSADDHRDGYIHFSSASQVAQTLAKYFSGQPDLVLLAVDCESLGENIRWESARGGQPFPHLYAELACDQVLSVFDLPLNSDGVHMLPEELGTA